MSSTSQVEGAFTSPVEIPGVQRGEATHSAMSVSGTGRSTLDAKLLVAGALLTAAVFVVDLMLPLGYAGGMLYVVPVALGLWATSARFTLSVALVATGLTVLGYLLSSGASHTTVLLNRGGALLAIWVVSLLVRQSVNKREELRGVENVLRSIHAMAARPELDFGERVCRLLDIGRERLGLSMGIFSRVAGDRYEVVEVSGDGLPIQAGEVLSLADTPCAHTIDADRVIRFGGDYEAVPASVGSDHPDLRVGAYIGSPVRVGGRVVGTLAFTGGRGARRFSPADDEIIKLMARWVGGELARRESAAALEESERQFQQAQKLEAVGRLASGVAHDFNNLLMGIGGSASVALKRLPPSSPARQYVEEVKRAALGGASITKQLLTFSRKQDDAVAMSQADHVVRGNARMLRRVLGEDVQLHVELGARDAAVGLAAGQLEQILMNLVVNARDAMPSGGELWIETEELALPEQAEAAGPGGLPAGDYVALRVRDTGSGMSKETQARVFEPFFTTKGVGEGTGLGLSSVYGLVQRVGGRVQLDSELGVGTTFTILIPSVDLDEAGAAGAGAVTQPRYGHETVLLVEDEPVVASVIQHSLESWGYEVRCAGDGPEGIELARDESGGLDLLITDMVLPKMGGTEIARRVQELHPEVAVIYMSAYPRDKLEREGRIEPTEVSLQKPFAEETLAARLRELLGPGIEPPAGVDEPEPAAAPEVVEPTTERSSPGRTVLLVEDDLSTRVASRELLAELGLEVLDSPNGAGAMAASAEAAKKIDAVITDINLPDVSGPQLVDELRAERPDLAAVYVSGRAADDPTVREALARPRTAFVAKPVDIDHVVEVVDSLLGGA